MQEWIYNFFQNNNRDTDFKQRSQIELTNRALKLCLLSILILSCSITLLLFFVWLVERSAYNGVSPLLPTTFSAVMTIILKIHSRISAFKVSVLVVSLLSFFGYYLSFGWGVDVPQSLLIYSLSIVVCGMLLGARAILVLFGIHGIVLISIAVLQANQMLSYQQDWKNEYVHFADGLAVTIMLAIIALASYVFNKQVETSTAAANYYLTQLTNERNLLEKEVLKRTEQLRTAHLDRIHQLNTLAELGKSSAHMLHDMAQPVTAAFLALEDIRQRSRSKTIRDQLKLTDHALSQIEQYICVMRSTIKQSSTPKKSLLRPILERNCFILTHQLRLSQTRLNIICHHRLQFRGNSDLLTPILSNLLTNAIDACKTVAVERRAILCSAQKTNNTLVIEVSDTGSGIDSSDLNLVFEPFFSRKKSNHNLGLGLSQVKDIVTSQMNGKITVRSSPQNGTTFTITLPCS